MTSITYCFRLPDHRQEIFELTLDPQTLGLASSAGGSLPSWTALDFHQCPGCVLQRDAYPHCPVASQLYGVVSRFADLLSYDALYVEVTIDGRRVSQDTTAQIGISSLMGLLMAASGCPHMAFFKPMARFHLPLATDEETTYRAVSTYLLGQYFVAKSGGQADFELEGLKKIYNRVQQINACIVKRLKAAIQTDSSINAVVTLDMFAKSIVFAIEEHLEEIRWLFAPHETENDPRVGLLP